MAYGNPVSSSKRPQVKVVRTVNSDGNIGSTVYDISGTWPFYAWDVRTGTNSVRVSRRKVRPPAFFVKKTKLVKTGRLKKAYYNRELGRYTKNTYAESSRIQRKRSKSVEIVEEKYDKQNQLRFDRTRMMESGARSVTSSYSVYNPSLGRWQDYSFNYSGEVWAPFSFYGGSTASGPNLLNYKLDTAQRFTNAAAVLQNELLAKFSDFATGAQAGLGQMLAERKQTFSLMTDALKRLAKTYKAVRSGNLAEASKALLPTDSKKLAGDRLAYQFGVLPLIGDIQDIGKVLTDAIRFPFKFRRRRRMELAPTVLYDSTVRGVRTRIVEEGVVEMRYSVDCEFDSSSLPYFSKLGFAPLELMWELTPWSFVIDWFLPIGDAISQRTTLALVTPTSIVRTTFITRQVTMIKTFAGTDTGLYKWKPAETRMVVEEIRCWREVLTSLPSIQPFTVNEDPLNLTRVLNGLALLRQLRK